MALTTDLVVRVITVNLEYQLSKMATLLDSNLATLIQIQELDQEVIFTIKVQETIRC